MAPQQDEKIYLVCLMIEDGGSLAECTAIKHEGKLWLVPQWLDIPTEQVTKPERIVCMDGLPYQIGGRMGKKQFDYILNHPVPTSVLYGPDPSQTAGPFVVQLNPDLRYPLRRGLH